MRVESGEWRVKSGDIVSAERTIRIAPKAHHNSTLHSPHSTLTRVLVGLAVPALLLVFCLALLRGAHGLCPFYELTGLYCPGCGSGRAALALLHGRVGAAFGHNALFTLLAIPCACILGREYLRFVFPGLGLAPTRLPDRTGPACLALILAFWLLRNLPAFAFLAP